MLIETFPDRTAWLEARRKGIGGSDVGPILGLSRWATPLSVWASKLGLAPEQEETYSHRRGHHMEGLIAEELERETGLSVEPGEFAIVRHPQNAVLAYSPDAFILSEQARNLHDAIALAEFKSRGYGRDDWQDGVPADVQAQVQHGLYVCDLPLAYVAVDLVSEFRWAKVPRDPAWAETNVPKLLAFWDLVVKQEPPEPTADDKATLGALYPDPSGETIALPGEMLDDAQTWAECVETIKACETKKDEIENRVRATLGAATKGVLPDGSTWTWGKQSRPKMVPDPTQAPSEFRVLRRGGVKKER